MNRYISGQPHVRPILFDAEKCAGCNRCVEACQMDVLAHNPEGKPPLVMYPEECWYCGCCVMECPNLGAIRLRHPLMNQVSWIEKSELYDKTKLTEKGEGKGHA